MKIILKYLHFWFFMEAWNRKIKFIAGHERYWKKTENRYQVQGYLE